MNNRKNVTEKDNSPVIIKERLFKAIDLLNETVESIAEKSGINRSTLLNKTSEIGSYKLSLILKTYPQINKDYILLGKGEPLINIQEEIAKAEIIKKQEEIIASLREAISAKDMTIASKDEVIESKNQIITLLGKKI